MLETRVQAEASCFAPRVGAVTHLEAEQAERLIATVAWLFDRARGRSHEITQDAYISREDSFTAA
jgi:hypothetical protein